MEKYLVTGGAGFIGSNLVRKIIENPDKQVTIVDDLSMGKLENIPSSGQVEFIHHSINDHEFITNLLNKKKFDYIVLLAAIASVADSVERPFATHLTNQEANLNIIETLRKNKIVFKKLFFASSAAVYGNKLELPKREDMAVEPLTQYAVDKYATERAIINYARLYDMPMVCGRFFNVYGPRQNPESPYSGVLSIIMNKLINGDAFQLFGNGRQTRDFVYVGDVVHAILGILSNNKMTGEVFNIANGKQESLSSVIESFEQVTNKKLTVVKKPVRSGDIHDSYADVSKADEHFLLEHTSFSTGLQKYVEYVSENGL